MTHPDQKYIDALLTNNTSLLSEIYQKYFPKIKWMVIKNNGTPEDASDIFQEALITIFQRVKAQQFVLTCPLDYFIYLICRRKWLHELKKKKAGNVTFIDDEGYNRIGEDSFKLAEEHSLWQARQDLFTRILNELGETCRKVLRLSWNTESMEEVASILKSSYGYARKRKSECKAKLVKLYMSDPEFENLKW